VLICVRQYSGSVARHRTDTVNWMVVYLECVRVREQDVLNCVHQYSGSVARHRTDTVNWMVVYLSVCVCARVELQYLLSKIVIPSEVDIQRN